MLGLVLVYFFYPYQAVLVEKNTQYTNGLPFISTALTLHALTAIYSFLAAHLLLYDQKDKLQIFPILSTTCCSPEPVRMAEKCFFRVLATCLLPATPASDYSVLESDKTLFFTNLHYEQNSFLYLNQKLFSFSFPMDIAYWCSTGSVFLSGNI
ncbi:hypothetical protein HMI54_009865 [Coelomomyces lativittatus]|nr:hypothetical protein HMI54_009865 [Coelomomyces lativittatus]